jgi:hypothetical protein
MFPAAGSPEIAAVSRAPSAPSNQQPPLGVAVFALIVLVVGRGERGIGKACGAGLVPAIHVVSAQRMTRGGEHGRRALFCKPLLLIAAMSASSLETALRGWPGVSCTRPAMTASTRGHQPQNANQQLRCFLLQKPEYCVIAVGSARTDLRLNCKALDGGGQAV